MREADVENSGRGFIQKLQTRRNHVVLVVLFIVVIGLYIADIIPPAIKLWFR